MTMRSIVLAAVLIAQAAAPQTPPRDVVRRETTGEARIAGIVADDTGAPLERALVLLVGDSASASRTAITSADGRYAFDGLPDGSFTLTVSKAGFPVRVFGQPARGMKGTVIRLARAQRFTANVTVPRGCAIAGIVLDEEGAPLPSARVVAYHRTYWRGMRSFYSVGGAISDSRGRYRIFGAPAGEFLVAAPEPRAESDRPPANAVELTLAPGEQRTGIELRRAAPDATGRLHVTVSLPPGLTAPNYRVTLRQEDGRRSRFDYRQEPSFEVRDVRVGSYDLVLDARLSPPGPRTPGAVYWAAARVSVEADQSTDVSLALQRGMSIEGRIVFEEPAPPPGRWAQPFWSLPSANPRLAPGDNVYAQGSIEPTGAFAARGVLPGAYTVESPLPGWHLKSIVVDGRDRTDTGILVEGGRDVAGVVVTFTDRTTEWRGTIRSVAGAPAPDNVIVIYPRNESLWVKRRIAITQPDSAGAFVVRGLPAGNYDVAAVTTIEPDQWLDPAFLKTLRPVMSLALEEGQPVTRDVSLR